MIYKNTIHTYYLVCIYIYEYHITDDIYRNIYIYMHNYTMYIYINNLTIRIMIITYIYISLFLYNIIQYYSIL